MDRPRWGDAPKCLFKAKPADACASQRAILNDEPTVVEANKVGIITDSDTCNVYFKSCKVYQSILQILASIFQILAKYI